jgi:hypothetical protein
MTVEPNQSVPPQELPAPSGAARLLLSALGFYREWLSPALHSLSPGGCKFLPTCSAYPLVPKFISSSPSTITIGVAAA